MAFWFRRSGHQTGEGAGASIAEEQQTAECAADDAPTGGEPADDAALKEFLFKNFLCEEDASRIKAETAADEAAPALAYAPAPALSERIETSVNPQADDWGDESPETRFKSSAARPEEPKTAEFPDPKGYARQDFDQAHTEPPATAPEIISEPAAARVGTEFIEPIVQPVRAVGESDGAASERAGDSATQTFPPSDWAFEEKLASHKEWVDSKGMMGKRAALSDAKLQGAELISVNLRYADLHAANMQAADLLLADLRDACLTRADLEESCLVGANLEAANLEGASLGTAMGLVNRQLAGANLRDASLPAQILEFPAREEFEGASRAAWRYFTAILSMAALSLLALWKVRDVQLIADRSILPFLHSAAAATALPTAELFLIVPVAVFILYAVFQFHLQRVWDAALELPAIFPDGRVLGEGSPRIVVGLLRAHFRWMNQDAPSTRFIEKAIAVCLGYWLAPALLLLFWARYLTRQDLHGTALLEVLAAAATGIAFYASARIGRRQERWIFERKLRREFGARIAAINPVTVMIVALGVLTVLGVGTIKGLPHDKARAPQFMSGDVRRWAPTVFWSVGFDPYADLTEAAISRRPANWTGDSDQLGSVTGARLSGARLRYAQGYGAFLANAHLWRADLQGAFLSQADLRGADLSQASLYYTVLESANLSGANLNRARLEEANLGRADLRSANLSYASLAGARLVDAQLQGASLYSAQLASSDLARANLEKTDLRDAHLEGANLAHADVQRAYVWSAKLASADLEGARLGGAIFIGADLRLADLREAQMTATVLNDANLTGAILDGADLRGALGLTAKQVCSGRSHAGALLDPQLEMQVNAQCGAPGSPPIAPQP